MNYSALTLLPWVLLIVVAVIHLAFTSGVARYCQRRTEEGRETQLVSAGIWILATFFGGPVVACLYWMVNESGLNREAYLKREQ